MSVSYRADHLEVVMIVMMIMMMAIGGSNGSLSTDFSSRLCLARTQKK